jgi:acetyl esterase/lipase
VPTVDGLVSPVSRRWPRAATYEYGPDGHQLLDVYVPDGAPATGAPVLVYFHAGGWVAGARTDLPDIDAAQLARGWAVVSVDYALAPEQRFPQPVLDGDRAVRWVRANGGALGLDPRTIVAVGASAGGHIAAWLAANPTRYRVDDAVLGDVRSGVDAAVLLVTPVVMADLRARRHSPAILAYLGCAEERADRCTDEQLAAGDPTRNMGPRPHRCMCCTVASMACSRRVCTAPPSQPRGLRRRNRDRRGRPSPATTSARRTSMSVRSRRSSISRSGRESPDRLTREEATREADTSCGQFVRVRNLHTTATCASLLHLECRRPLYRASM